MCRKPEGGFDAVTFDLLHTTLSLDDALDLAEINAVDRSWRDAALANSEPPPAPR